MNIGARILILFVGLAAIWGGIQFGNTTQNKPVEYDAKQAIKQTLYDVADMVQYDWDGVEDRRHFKTIKDVQGFRDLSYSRALKEWSHDPEQVRLSNAVRKAFDESEVNEGTYDAEYVKLYVKTCRKISDELE